MSVWTRLKNTLRNERLQREIDEELESPIAEAAAAQGRDPDETRRAFGSALRHREASRDVRLLTWLDSLRADAIFGLCQLRKNTTSLPICRNVAAPNRLEAWASTGRTRLLYLRR